MPSNSENSPFGVVWFPSLMHVTVTYPKVYSILLFASTMKCSRKVTKTINGHSLSHQQSFFNSTIISFRSSHEKAVPFQDNSMRNVTRMCSSIQDVQADHDHVDGVRLHLWTAATNGPMLHSPGDIWAWTIMVEWRRQGKLISSPQLSGNPTSSLAQQEELAT
jgi:hypothetical protein